MRAPSLIVRALAGAVLLASLTACNDEPTVMPDVTAKRLDVALSDLELAGYDDEAEVLGGGVFGVLDESNWTVCTQEPAADEAISSTPRLTVERSCEDTEEAAQAEADEDAAAAEPEAEETEETEETDAEESAGPAPKAAQTAKAAQAAKAAKVAKKRRARQAETFVMPMLVGANLQDAQDLLQSLGSFFLSQDDATGMGRFQVLDSGWKVCSQNFRPGARISIARLVNLDVVKLDERCP